MHYFKDIDTTHIRGMTILLDVDGTLVADGLNDVAEPERAKIAELCRHNEVWLCSNSRIPGRIEMLSLKLGVPSLNSPYKKPDRRVIDALPKMSDKSNGGSKELNFLLIGDKFLTDGLCAKALRGRFIRVQRITSTQEHVLVKITNTVDTLIGSLLYRCMIIQAYLKLIRPKQWIKNLLIFVPLFFSGQFTDIVKLDNAAYTFKAFCLMASALYVINDIIDRKSDAAHSYKRHRPIAAGIIPVSHAIVYAILLAAASIALMLYFVPIVLPTILLWAILTFLYSIYLKRQPVYELLLIAFFYFLRVYIGGVATQTPLSNWLILCVVFLALFIIVAKRKAEFSQESRRAVLDLYTSSYLDHLLTISVCATLISYGIYTVLGNVPSHAVYSNFFVMLGLFRYLHIVYTSNRSESPENVIFDGTILISMLCWIVFMFSIIY
jgi:4-hydroxybenzoate polyprenyltransferase/predicted HAD superfamily phosphohydrolase YqeG